MADSSSSGDHRALSWETLAIAVMVVLAIVEVAVLLPRTGAIANVPDWVPDAATSNLELLPPALIGVLIVYTKSVGQDRAAAWGTVLVAVMAPFAALAVIPIDDGLTFVVVLLCLACTGGVVSRHVPHSTCLDIANLLFVAFGISGAIALIVPGSIEPEATASLIRSAASWATLAFVLGSAVLYALAKPGLFFAVSAYLILTVALIVGLWWVLVQVGLVENRLWLAQALVFATMGLLAVAPTGFVILWHKLR